MCLALAEAACISLYVALFWLQQRCNNIMRSDNNTSKPCTRAGGVEYGVRRARSNHKRIISAPHSLGYASTTLEIMHSLDKGVVGKNDALSGRVDVHSLVCSQHLPILAQ